MMVKKNNKITKKIIVGQEQSTYVIKGNDPIINIKKGDRKRRKYVTETKETQKKEKRESGTSEGHPWTTISKSPRGRNSFSSTLSLHSHPEQPVTPRRTYGRHFSRKEQLEHIECPFLSRQRTDNCNFGPTRTGFSTHTYNSNY